MDYLERPSNQEMKRVLEKYGRIRRRIVDWDRRRTEESALPPGTDGEVVLILLLPGPRMVAIKRPNSPDGQLIIPTGPIARNEGIEEAAQRLALELTGLEAEVDEIAALHQVKIVYKQDLLERWFFIVLCRPKRELETLPDGVEGTMMLDLPPEMPADWIRNQWYLWVLKDAGLLHPHTFLLGKAPEPGSVDGGLGL